MGFGIAVDGMPVSYNGERKLKNYKKWIKRRYVKEEALSQNEVFEGVDLPGKLIYHNLLDYGESWVKRSSDPCIFSLTLFPYLYLRPV